MERRVDDYVIRKRIAEGLEIFREYGGDLRIAGGDRLCHGGVSELGFILLYAGRLEEAAAIQHRLLELDPTYLGVHAYAAVTLLLMGKNTEALAEALKETEEVSRLPDLALIYWAADRKSDADIALRQLESRFPDVAAYDIGEVHAYRGEADAAVTWLERSYRQRGENMLLLKVDPLLRNLRSDPRYRSLLRRMNLPDGQAESGRNAAVVESPP
jgi:serine/threonine-protein kinase